MLVILGDNMLNNVNKQEDVCMYCKKLLPLKPFAICYVDECVVFELKLGKISANL